MDGLFKDGSNLTYDRLDVAKSVLVELRGKHEVATARARKRPPPPPPPPTLPQHAEVRLTSREITFKIPEHITSTHLYTRPIY